MASIRQEKARKDYAAHRYLICFVEREERSWWDIFTREGFRHCFMLQWCEWSQRWLMVDWRRSTTDLVILFDFEARDLVKSLHLVKGTVISYPPTNPNEEIGGLVTYCSNLMARHLGLGNRLILTPFALYRRLLATGGEIVFSWRDENEQQTQADRPTAPARAEPDRKGAPASG